MRAHLLDCDNVVFINEIDRSSIAFTDSHKDKCTLNYCQCGRDGECDIIRSEWRRHSVAKIDPNCQCEEYDDKAECAANDKPAAMMVVVEFD
jgi:hypothetical protein